MSDTVTTPPRDYYETLGVARNADPKAIKDAFRTLALKYHPDRNKEPGAEERFKDIAQAYAILSDPQKRANYDAQGFAGVAGFSQEDLFGGINFDDIFGGLNFDFGDGGLFDALFRRRRRVPAQGANLEVDLAIALERVLTGGEETLRLQRPVACPTCHGTGEQGGVAPPACPGCGGTGRVARSQSNPQDQVLIQHISVCPQCHGRGSMSQNPCKTCQGSGQTEQQEVLKVQIPPGVDEGLALRVPGKGMPGPGTGAAAGDLYVVVRTRPDPRFERVGADLVRQEALPVVDAVLGTTLKVPTLEGTASVAVPPGTQPADVLRLSKKGLPAFGGGPRGDLYLRMVVEVPQHLTRQERELYDKLRALHPPTNATP